jgi:phosphatidylinositol alpha-mannosyltransferase
MKIGLVCPYDMNKGGGVKECVQALYEGLVRNGHDVRIITPRLRGTNGDNKDTIYLGTSTDFRSPTHTTSQIGASGDGSEIDAMLEREQFDVLHFHEPWIPILSRQILSRSTCANVATFHAKLPETLMSRTFAKVVTPYTKSVLKYLHSFTAVSEAAMEYLRTMTDQPVSIIPNGIDLKNFHAPRQHIDRKVKKILYIGRLEKRKGVNYLLRAFAVLLQKNPNVQLVIAGDGVDRQKLENLCNELDIREHVEFLGFITETKKKQLLRSCDLFCSPAVYGESFGIVLLEAMASGLVTVAGNNPGYSSVLHGLGSISLVNPKHVDEFAHRLNLLLEERDLRKLWRMWAHTNVPQYDYPNVVKQYEAVYLDAIENYGK